VTRSTDVVVIGAGVIGVAIAAELRRRHPARRVTVLEKEHAAGEHASGRNSGVLHAGFYYTADSLKARFSRVGNTRMRAWCGARGLRLACTGKLVVARDAGELAGLDELSRRAAANGVELHTIDAAEAHRIEPRARTFERALWSPTTATVDPAEVMADRLARTAGFSRHYPILPFKGLYLHSSEPPGAFRTHVYPVPNLANPFLGVHLTVSVDGHAKIGPTAIPCLWREQYDWLHGFRAGEAAAIVADMARLCVGAGFDFRGLALEEARKYHRPTLVARAAALAHGIRAEDYTRWGRPGIRAQLLDVRDRTLVQDFRLEGDERSLHVLNAVSPGFTCALPFADFVCDTGERLRAGGAPVTAGKD